MLVLIGLVALLLITGVVEEGALLRLVITYTPECRPPGLHCRSNVLVLVEEVASVALRELLQSRQLVTAQCHLHLVIVLGHVCTDGGSIRTHHDHHGSSQVATGQSQGAHVPLIDVRLLVQMVKGLRVQIFLLLRQLILLVHRVTVHAHGVVLVCLRLLRCRLVRVEEGIALVVAGGLTNGRNSGHFLLGGHHRVSVHHVVPNCN